MTGIESLKGKIALVSGSAKGIGAAICVELASKSVAHLFSHIASRLMRKWSRGALVIVNYPWPSELPDAEAVLDRIRKTESSSVDGCFAVEADLSTLEGPAHLVEQTIKRVERKIDILVNNAGVAVMAPLADVTLTQWDVQVNLNVRGAMLLTQAVLPHLAQNSRIVNLSSVGARQGYVGSGWLRLVFVSFFGMNQVRMNVLKRQEFPPCHCGSFPNVIAG